MSNPKPTVDNDLPSDQDACPECEIEICSRHLARTSHNIELIEQSQASRAKARVELPTAEFTGSYEVLERIGEGGMSVVYRGRHRILQHDVAIKMLHAHLLRDAIQTKRFEQEAQALNVLEHPNIVRVRDFGIASDGAPYLIMDFLEGTSLSELIKKEGTIPVPRALNIFMQACDALEHAHAKGIIHRDIKPSNIVVQTASDKDTVKIVDFGIAKLTQDSEVNPGLTQTGDVFGSPLYMSPEQCLGAKLDARADLYSFGCVMYEALSGNPPFISESALATIHKHTTATPEPIVVPNCDPRLRERLDEIIFKTLEKDPDKRYQSMAQLKKDLKDLSETTVYKGKAGSYVRYARWHRKLGQRVTAHPYRSVGIASAILAMLVFSTYFTLTLVQPLSAEPAYSTSLIDFVYYQPDARPKGLDYEDKKRKLMYICDERLRRLGGDSPATISGVVKLTSFLIDHGDWREAYDYFRKILPHLTTNTDKDFKFADTMALAGEACLQTGDYEKAENFYDNAVKAYAKIDGMSGGAIVMSMNRLASLKLKRGRPDEAYTVYRGAIDVDSGDAEDKATSDAGVGDSVLRMILGDVYPKDKIPTATLEAKRYYFTAFDRLNRELKLKSEDANENLAIIQLRRADLNMLDKNYQSAALNYADSEHTDPSLFKSKKILENYARVLWHAGNYPAALKLWSAAMSVETDSAASPNENRVSE